MRTLVLLALSIGAAPPVVNASERLYATSGTGPSTHLSVLDPENARLLYSMAVPGVSTESLSSLVTDGSRLLGLDVKATLPSADSLVELHPADARMTHLGFTGLDQFNGELAYDSLTGRLYLSHYTDLYSVEPSTGAATLVAPFTGLKPADCICAIFVESAGTGIGLGIQGPSVYRVSLADGACTLLGELPPLGGGGFFTELTRSAGGRVLGMYQGPASFQGIYELDVQALTAVPLLLTGFATFSGMTFGPDCLKTPYCTAKTNSQGCTPALSARGLASASGTSGFWVEAHDVLNQSFGALFYSLSGQSSLPFGGGTLCIASPTFRTKGLARAGGSALPFQDCTGTWSADLNELLFTQAPGLAPGTIVNVQWIGRDRGFGRPNAMSLSAGLEVTLCP